jgi:predicted esterase
MTATVCFCHGRESGPWGTKIRCLARVAEHFGCRVVSRDDRDIKDPDERVHRLLASSADMSSPLIIVGSSMGGYVAVMASSTLRPVGLFLMAPAIGLPGYQWREPQPEATRMTIVHGWDDTVVPLKNVLDFAGRHRATLHLLDDDHVLQNSLMQIERLFADFLATSLGCVQPAMPARALVACL